MVKKPGSLRRISKEVRDRIFRATLDEKNHAKSRSVLADELETEFGDKSPSLDTLMKLISRARVTARKKNPLDEPWSMGCLVRKDLPQEDLPRLDLPPAAIPVILELQDYCKRNSKHPLTIREAWWASRLQTVITKTRALPLLKVLHFWAVSFTASERLSLLLGESLDTSKDEALLRSHAEAYALNSFRWDDLEKAEGFEAAASYFEYELDLVAKSNEIDDRLNEIDTRLSEIDSEIDADVKKLLREEEKLLGEEEKLLDDAYKVLREQQRRQVPFLERMIAKDRELSAKHKDFPSHLAELERMLAETLTELSKKEGTTNERTHRKEG